MHLPTDRYCLIGHPLGHSLSPFIHRRLFSLQGREASYDLSDIPPQELPEALAALLQQIDGCNVTIPHKQAVIPFIDRLEGKAALYGTVNCICVTQDGTVGYNTDADGFLCALKSAGLSLSGTVLLLGCGGVGTMFACESALAGCEVLLYDAVSAEKAAALCERLYSLVPDGRFTVLDTLDGIQKTVDLLINATPVGMYPKIDACPAPDTLIARCGAVFDAVYNPRETVLMKTAAANGIPAAGGMAMLVWQAAVAHTHWYNARFAHEDIERLIDDCYAELARRFSKDGR